TFFTFLTPISAKVGLGYLLLCQILLGIGIVIALPISTWLGSGPLEWPGIFWTFGTAVESGGFVKSENNDTDHNTPLEIYVIEENSDINELLTNNLKLPTLKQVPWKLMFSHREVWAILITQFCNSFM
ncbi:6649_t:CDS:2, partial [Scutellospora calospora]